VAADPALELLAPVETSIVAFRARPAGLSEAELNELNQALPLAVQRRGQAFVTGTLLGGREAMRACLINAATSEADLTVLLDEVRCAAAELTS
jgi:glutamate/tyrosine decarboxylase-like PLP-dependent enzyme